MNLRNSTKARQPGDTRKLQGGLNDAELKAKKQQAQVKKQQQQQKKTKASQEERRKEEAIKETAMLENRLVDEDAETETSFPRHLKGIKKRTFSANTNMFLNRRSGTNIRK